MDEAFIDHLRQTKSFNTAQAYLKSLSDFEHWFEVSNGEQLTAIRLTPTDLREYRQDMAQRKLAPATVNLRLAAVQAYATFHQLELGPVKSAKIARPDIHWLNKQEQAALWREVERDYQASRSPAARTRAARNRSVIALLIGAGLRLSELCDLDLGDVEISSRSGSVRVRHGKGDKERTVPLNADVRKYLAEWIALRSTEGDWLFAGQRQERLRQSGVSDMIGEYARRAKVEATAHSLRHSFAKNLVNAGVGIERVAMLLGHDSLETTRLYTLPSQQDLARDVERIAG